MGIDLQLMAEILRDIAADRPPEESRVQYTPELLRWRIKQTVEFQAWQDENPGATLMVPAELEEDAPAAGEGSFRKAAAGAAGARWGRMDEGQRRGATRDRKTAWLEEALGGAGSREGFGAWLKRQPKGVQDDCLGRVRAKLFREGGLTIERFTDPAGRPLTLEQLARTRPEAFTQAGLDPDDYDGEE